MSDTTLKTATRYQDQQWQIFIWPVSFILSCSLALVNFMCWLPWIPVLKVFRELKRFVQHYESERSLVLIWWAVSQSLRNPYSSSSKKQIIAHSSRDSSSCFYTRDSLSFQKLPGTGRHKWDILWLCVTVWSRCVPTVGFAQRKLQYTSGYEQVLDGNHPGSMCLESFRVSMNIQTCIQPLRNQGLWTTPLPNEADISHILWHLEPSHV